MKLSNNKIYKFIIALVIIPFISPIYAQQTTKEKYNRMVYSNLFDLEEDWRKDAVELLTYDKYADFKEDTYIFTIQYFMNSIIDDNSNNFNEKSYEKAYSLILEYQTSFPNGKYKDVAEVYISLIKSLYGDIINFYNTSSKERDEKNIVKAKMRFLRQFFEFKEPNKYSYFFEGNYELSGIDLAEKYFDDIIINNKDFEIIGYYYKIVILLDKINGTEYVKTIIGEKKDTTSYFGFGGILEGDASIENKKLVDEYLMYLSSKYPDHYLTLNAYMIVLSEYLKHEVIELASDETKKLTDYIIKNSNNRFGMDYMLMKEFLIKNEIE